MPFDRQYIDDQHVVARYLAEQLSDADREAFEAYCREHPETFRELEAAARVKVGLAVLEESQRLGPLLAARPAGSGVFVRRHAASIAVLGVGIVLLAAFGMLRTPMMGRTLAEVSGRFGAALPMDAEYGLARNRKPEDFDLHVALPPVPSAIRILVLPDGHDSSSYRATLSRETEAGEKFVGSADRLVPGENHCIALYLDSRKLQLGAYSLVVAPDDARPHDTQTAFRIEVAATKPDKAASNLCSPDRDRATLSPVP